MPFRVGLISGSARVVRAGPQIAAFVRGVIEKDIASQSTAAVEFDVIDVGTLDLPAHYDEPGIPSHVENIPDDYVHEHTRAWSRRVASLDTFVFVTPQYNWGVPAALKNAIDYLFKEWRGKPFMVVSYGGHGGGHAAAALQLILGGGIGMKAAPAGPVSLSFPDRGVLKKAAKGEDLELAEDAWADKQATIVAAWRQVVELLQE